MLPESVKFQGPFSYILCSEILYLPKFHRALLKTLTKFSDEHTVVLLLWKQRGLGEERFFDIACRPSTGWKVQYVSIDPSLFLHVGEKSRHVRGHRYLTVLICCCCFFWLAGEDGAGRGIPGPTLWGCTNDTNPNNFHSIVLYRLFIIALYARNIFTNRKYVYQERSFRGFN